MARNLARLGLMVALTVCIAKADVIFSLGANPQTNEQQVQFTVGDNGHTITGTTSNPAFDVVLYSKSDPLKVFAHGSNFGIQTDHDDGNNDTSVNDVAITVTGGDFQDLIGSIYGVFAQHPEIDFTVWTTDSKTPFTFSFTGNLANHGNEDNFFTISTANNELISEVLITGKFFELRDLDISGVTKAPEPASLLLVASGLLFFARKRHNR